MNKINCNANNCSHNSNGVCYANRINVGGQGATEACETCCGSFLDKKHYSTLTNNTNADGPCDCIVCTAEKCIIQIVLHSFPNLIDFACQMYQIQLNIPL